MNPEQTPDLARIEALAFRATLARLKGRIPEALSLERELEALALAFDAAHPDADDYRFDHACEAGQSKAREEAR